MENQTVQEGKTTAIVSYLWIIGLIIAYFMNKDKKNSFASFHIRQMVGLTILSFAVNLLSRVGGESLSIVFMVISLGIMVLWIIGFIGAIQGKENAVPLLGKQFQEWFKNV